jgi:glycosyltransferase involved in cell wall biosynthesis
MPRVTILMPVYNGEQFLEETIENVLQQTYTDFVFLIINDGSTDGSEKIIQSYTDTRIRYVKNERNFGLVTTLNKGIDLVDTEFMARMDADDLWVETKLEKQIKVLDSQPEVGICGTSIRKFGAFEGDFYFPVDNEALKVGFLFYCTMSHPSVVFRMSFLKETGLRYKTDYFPAEDYKMWIDSLQLTQIYNIPELLVYYRQHDTQICSTANAAKQSVLQNTIRLEMLERISKNFTLEEKQFHIQQFVSGQIRSKEDYQHFVAWSQRIARHNRKETSYIDPSVLRKEMNTYIQQFYKGYILRKYFTEKYLFELWRYFCSLEWRHLSFRRNVGIILKNRKRG